MSAANAQRLNVGIVGFGRIGRAVAKRAAGFGMTILYHSAKRADRAVLVVALAGEGGEAQQPVSSG